MKKKHLEEFMNEYREQRDIALKGWDRSIAIAKRLKDLSPGVIRCKDCKYYAMHTDLSPEEFVKAMENPISDFVCDYWATDGVSPYDYCSRAEYISLVERYKK